MKQIKTKIKKNYEDLLWNIPKNIWRISAAFGSSVFIFAAVFMNIYGWFIDDKTLLIKALKGLGFGAIYFIVSYILTYMNQKYTEKGKISSDTISTLIFIMVIIALIVLGIFGIIYLTSNESSTTPTILSTVHYHIKTNLTN